MLLELEEADDRARDVRVRQRPLERRLRIRVRVGREVEQAAVLGPLERLHR